MSFDAAALILTRVISRPTADTVTLDLGYKACASDPPAGRRLMFPFIADAEEVLQNEEHLVIRTARANDFEPGSSDPGFFVRPAHTLFYAAPDAPYGRHGERRPGRLLTSGLFTRLFEAR